MFFIASCRDKKINNEQKIFDRIEFVFNLKQTVEEDGWKSFNDKKFDVPLIYYTDTTSYVANPTGKFLKTFKSKLVFQIAQLSIYKTDRRIDNLPFHMETGCTLGTPTAQYDYHSPFMKCSSYEEVIKKIPTELSTEEWVTMIIHEYFHGFQYKHQSYMEYMETNMTQIKPDSLTSFYKHHSWFKKLIDAENELLLHAIEEPNIIKARQIIDTFLTVRSERRNVTKQKLRFEIQKPEKFYETMEGTARYVEYSLYRKFSTKKPDYKLKTSDASFKSFAKFKHYNIEYDEWLYKTEKTAYFYAIGFNMARLLDKLNIDFKKRLFDQGGLSMEDILRTVVTSKAA